MNLSAHQIPPATTKNEQDILDQSWVLFDKTKRKSRYLSYLGNIRDSHEQENVCVSDVLTSEVVQSSFFSCFSSKFYAYMKKVPGK